MSKKKPDHPVTAEHVSNEAVNSGLIDPEQASEATARAVAADEPLPDIEIQIDPEMLQRAVANRNARLIAVLVNENAMLEVALESERRTTNELRSKVAAMQRIIDEMAG